MILHARHLLPGVLAAYLALVLHEAGHALAGKWAGFRFAMLGVGPLCVARSGSTLAVRWLPPSYWGPFGVSYPASVERWSARFGWYTAGGPLASLGLSVVSALCARYLPDPAGRWCEWLALTSAAVFVATAQPFATGFGVPSDGARLLGLVRNDAQARAAAALAALESLDAAGVRPRDWDPGLVDLAGTVRRPPAYVLGAATALLRHALDGDDATAARAHIEQLRKALPSVPRWFRADAAAEAAFWFAHFAHDPATASGFFRESRGPLTAAQRTLRAEAAVRLETGDLAGARVALERARAALDRSIHAASSLDRMLIDAIGQDLERRESTSRLESSAPQRTR